jgi:alpha-mannosidase
MGAEIVVHMVGNAHLDPVWLWGWQAGLDEALATCRSACDRLDRHPDLVFTRGEAWVYEQIERLDPALFDRICEHVAAGRWEIVGGWWIQPDCNFPSGIGFDRQMALGRLYFESRFGIFPNVAYNVDSFGHTAALPTIMRAHGQTRYVMMRPQEHEMALPARVFRWSEADGTPEVTSFRIAGAYTCREITLNHVQASLKGIPDGLGHTMCFFGVGDHGGGPTERQIAWIRENRDTIPGVRLEFSSPGRFFDAIAESADLLPSVTGELQMHAIGCYSVTRSIKTAVRRAEHLLEQARIADPDADLTEAWKRVCFGQFHDTLGGTAIPSAYTRELDAVGYAATVADETAQYAFRREMSALPDDPRQRIVAFNPSEEEFAGHLEFEPWLDWQDWPTGYWLSDAEGRPTPCQRVYSESLAYVSHVNGAVNYGLPRLLFPARLGAGEIKEWHIETGPCPEPARAPAMAPNMDCSVRTLNFRGGPLPMPVLALIEDNSDTWSHGIDRYAEDALIVSRLDAPSELDRGPLMRSWVGSGTIGRSDWRAEWRVYAGEPFIELRLRVLWREAHRLLKLVWPQSNVAERIDGVAGTHLRRPNSGRELPLRDWTSSSAGAIVTPDVYAIDATPVRVRLTLLRSPILAHHDPHNGVSPTARISDQGEHEFRFRFFGGSVEPGILNRHAWNMHRPPLIGDLTRGMIADAV